MNKLYQLPNGDWTEVGYVKFITSMDLTEFDDGGYIGPRVIVELGYANFMRNSICEYGSFEDACIARDRIANDINKLRKLENETTRSCGKFS